ncbi:hypothetical protein T07_2906 [Trichinella nelsoni]|uniref:Uncharacterized protein n=1 Tax=Trichinella nelsoni TaxID=6336 RepID=A0A0V0RJG3_9BILA|nr:hypothetical protein T07_2906 [Trichinella nelsoni]
MTSIVRANETRRLFNGFFRGAILGCMLRISGASVESKNAGLALSRLMDFVLSWQRIVIVLSVRLTTKYGPSFVGYSGGRGASFLGRMDPERFRKWSLRAAAFADSDSAKKTPDRRNAAAI